MEYFYRMKAILGTMIFLVSISSFAEDESPPDVGMFTLPVTQQPGPFFSFGQNLIGAKNAQLYVLPAYLKIQGGHFGNVYSSLLYGISDDASILFTLPVAVSETTGDNHSSGFQDTVLQMEYGFYNHSTSRYQELATIVGAISLPSGSANKNPITGIGTTGIFLGGTFNRTHTDWTAFLSAGGYYPGINEDSFREGSNYYYQGGIGHVITTMHKKLIFNWLLEIDGQYTTRNRAAGFADPDTGGNVVFLVPSLWFSTRNFIAQFGVGIPILQHLNGDQGNNRYYLAASLGWTL